jgi:4-aminobutyrate aminotransferase-like enzyme
MSARIDKAMANAHVPGKGRATPRIQALIDRRAELLGPAYRLMYQSPLHVVRGEGVYLYDDCGRAYLDAYNNVASLGHCHPAVVEAISRQASTLATNTRYLHELILDYAEKLIDYFPRPLQNVTFTCSGSEANDLAYRIAKVFTGGTGVIVTETAYHGITDTVAQFSPSLGKSVELGAHVRTVPAPATYRSGGQDASAFPQAVEAAIADLARHGVRTAMIIVDSLFTSDGVLTQPVDMLAPAVEIVRRAGGIYVADEVQAGFGRSGKHMWGFQRHDVVPDLVTLGKPMGNGQPIAAVVATRAVIEPFGEQARYFNTFAGNAVSCAAGLAVLKTIERDQLMKSAGNVGDLLKDQLLSLCDEHEQLGDIRAAGLMLGVEVVSDRSSRDPDSGEATRIVNALRDQGVLISSCGAKHNVLKIRPPLIFTDRHVEEFMRAFRLALMKK